MPPEQLAPVLIGALLTYQSVTLRLTEVEAYGGRDDPAAHAWRGPRAHTRDLFAEPGTFYCYRSHGIHLCGNVVCANAGEGSAILFRSGQVISGFDVARQRRPGVSAEALARGPGNLGRTMGWTLTDSGISFGEELQLVAGESDVLVASGPRVGVSVASQRPWRFWAVGDPTVSTYRRSPRIVEGRHDW